MFKFKLMFGQATLALLTCLRHDDRSHHLSIISPTLPILSPGQVLKLGALGVVFPPVSEQEFLLHTTAKVFVLLL